MRVVVPPAEPEDPPLGASPERKRSIALMRPD
jgi:hypothetical protein